MQDRNDTPTLQAGSRARKSAGKVALSAAPTAAATAATADASAVMRADTGGAAWTSAHAAACVGAALLAGCATTSLDAQWTDPQFQGRSLRDTTILVVCEAPDAAVKRLCEDRLAAEVVAYGATASIAPDGLPNPVRGREQAPSAYLPAARTAGAQAVLSAAVVSEVVPGRYSGPFVNIGIGSFGGGRIGVGSGIGISLPIGGGAGAYRHGLNGALTDVATGKLMWSGTASTGPSDDAGVQLSDLTRAVAEAAQKAGFF
ncbi:hypothetical protein [Methylibium sp.]|uniref:hypothetical protein n=1 Tax=Methylibium sp. TaxID=2067992 RepID=UPI0017B57A94|nr:hypothetical protein [Methylibium sp.]MBA3590060.1 hypothetical protein [Methylibium sp.]